MGNVRKNNYLKLNPTETFSMRFSSKYAKQLVELIGEMADEEDRPFPGAIERALVKYFKLKK